MLSSRMSAQDEEDVLAELATLQAEQVQVSRRPAFPAATLPLPSPEQWRLRTLASGLMPVSLTNRPEWSCRRLRRTPSPRWNDPSPPRPSPTSSRKLRLRNESDERSRRERRPALVESRAGKDLPRCRHAAAFFSVLATGRSKVHVHIEECCHYHLIQERASWAVAELAAVSTFFLRLSV